MITARRLKMGSWLATAVVLAAACGGSNGPRKVTVNEGVCGGAGLVRMKFGQTNRVIVDNTRHSEEQESITLVMERFPVIVKGDIPEGSTIGTSLSTIRITSPAGETRSVDVEPTGTGTYRAQCNASLHDPVTGQRRFVQTTIEMQLAE